VNLVLAHGSEPLPGGDRYASRGLTLRLKVGIAQGTDNVAGLLIQPIEIFQHRVIAISQLATAAGVRTRPAGDGLGVHVALDCREMSNQIAEGELARPVGPLEPLRRYTLHDSPSAAPKTIPVIQEFGGGLEGHVLGAPDRADVHF